MLGSERPEGEVLAEVARSELVGYAIRNTLHTMFTDINMLRYTSHAKGKASTAKQTCLGSLLGLELNLHCVMISSF